MAREMTPQERAAAVKHVVYMFGVPECEIATGEYENAIQEVLKMQAQIRRDVLTEARRAISKLYDEAHTESADYYTALLDAELALDRLREGVGK